MEDSLEKISRSPEQYPVVHREVLRALMRRFPFGIFYIHEKERVVVLAVFHGSRNPKDWMKRE
jgi:plasmid stabilization system protein ParE